MTKRDKLVQKILDMKPISSNDAEKILMYFGYSVVNREGSHITYGKLNKKHITLVVNKKEMKYYQIKLIQEAINE
ncbi:MAG: type II toxin-antitoxin system HicA family toxin [Candidatus Gastranaerophilaceae bacterium]